MGFFKRFGKKNKPVEPTAQQPTPQVDSTKGGGVWFMTQAGSYSLIETNKPGIMALSGGRENPDGTSLYNNVLVQKPGLISDGYGLQLNAVDTQGNYMNTFEIEPVTGSARALANIDKYIIPEMEMQTGRGYEFSELNNPYSYTGDDYQNGF